MTYNDFLNQFVGVISSFVSWLSMIANVLIHNYFFITLFGLALFVSIFWLIYYIFHDFIYDIIHKYDEYNDLYKNYELKKQVQSDYLNEHYNDEYDYLYRKRVLFFQVLNGVYQNNKDLIIDNKINNLDCNIDALKLLKQSKLVDNDDSNDNDVDMIIPNPPIHLSSFDELKRAELQQLHKELVEDNNREIDRILEENKDLLNKYDNNNSNLPVLSDESDLSTKPISNEGKYNFLKNNPQFLSDDWIVSDKGVAINKNTGEVIEM